MATFGNTTVEAADGNNDWQGYAIASPATLSEAGSVTSISVYLAISVSAHDVAGAIYADVAGQPVTLLGLTNTVNVGVSTGWIELPFASPVALSAGNYWLASRAAAGNSVDIYQRGTANVCRNKNGTLTDPYGSTATYQGPMSIYATYTTGQTFPSISFLNFLSRGSG